MKILFDHKTQDTLLCHFPKGQIKLEGINKLRLVKKEAQLSDSCWFDGPMMLANFLMCNLDDMPWFHAMEKHKEEMGGLYLLEHCYTEFVTQFENDDLKILSDHKNLLGVDFPDPFLTYLGGAISSPQREKMLSDHLKFAVEKGKETALKMLTTAINKMKFQTAQKTLVAIGDSASANHVAELNSMIPEEIKYNEMLFLMQQESIVSWLFKELTLTNCQTPKTPQDLYQLLESAGPVLVKNYFGIQSYRNDSAKCLGTISNVQLLGWDKSDYLNKSSPFSHANIVVGIKVNAENPKLSRVFFLDPKQTIDPYSQHKQVYSVGFEKFMSKVVQFHKLDGYRMTPAHQKEIEDSLVNRFGRQNHFFNEVLPEDSAASAHPVLKFF